MTAFQLVCISNVYSSISLLSVYFIFVLGASMGGESVKIVSQIIMKFRDRYDDLARNGCEIQF